MTKLYREDNDKIKQSENQKVEKIIRERLVEKLEFEKKVTTLEKKILELESNIDEAKILNTAAATFAATLTSPQVEIEQTTITITEDTMQKEFEQQIPAVPLRPESTIKIEELEALPATPNPAAGKAVPIIREPELATSEQKMDIIATTSSTPTTPSTPTDPAKTPSGQGSADGQKKIRKIKRVGLTSNEPDAKRHQTAPPSHNVQAPKVQPMEADTSAVQSTQTTTSIPFPVITTPIQSITTTSTSSVSEEIKNTQTTETETQQTSQKDVVDEPDMYAEGGSTDDNEDE